ncbi:MAG: helix-turn-helix transcriptional regulator [Candidatus Gastranaerophilales bacterium]|nr:helix-turn-helix transcriptional regulator [Candidatus Gastranaerophilales bacterium]
MPNLTLNEKIGIKVRVLRMRMKISQEELAELANLNKNSIGAIELGKSNPTIETLDKIAGALNIKLTELVDVSKIDL